MTRVSETQMRDAILNDPEWTRRVVTAAIVASIALEGPNPTRDGDDPAVGARSTLRIAIMDYAAIGANMREVSS